MDIRVKFKDIAATTLNKLQFGGIIPNDLISCW